MLVQHYELTRSTASMDNYAMLVVSGRISERLHHSTYVRSVLAIPDDMSPRQQLVLTGSDDEKIHVWDLSSEQRPPPHWTVEGHCGPVTSLQAWKSTDGQWKVVSADLDGTIRQWTLDGECDGRAVLIILQILFTQNRWFSRSRKPLITE